jgi:hypothetical protein
VAQARPSLRVVAGDLRGRGRELDPLSGLIREAAPDVAVLTGAPWRLRSRTRAADFAARSRLVTAAASPASVGNAVLVSLRVQVIDTWCVQYPLVPGERLRGAVLARCSVGGAAPFVVAGTGLAPAGPARHREAAVLARTLSEVDDPVVLAGDVAGTVLTQGRVEAARILVDPGIGITARHYARRERATAPVMVDLLLALERVPAPSASDRANRRVPG